MNDSWDTEKYLDKINEFKDISNSDTFNRIAKFTSLMLKEQSPSDEMVFKDESTVDKILEFRDSIVGSDINNISDVIWSDNVPLKDFILNVGHDNKVRICVFESMLKDINNLPEDESSVVGAVQFCKTDSFVILSIKKGESVLDLSKGIYDKNGNPSNMVNDTVFAGICHIIKLWHAIQLALLHPRLREIFSNGRSTKFYTREKDPKTRKRVRVVKYIKRFYVNEGDVVRNTRDFKYHCKAWYVIGHWRRCKSGKICYVKGYWKGEMRELKRNIDSDRVRDIELEDTKESGVGE